MHHLRQPCAHETPLTAATVATQVFDIASQQPLLAQPIPSCAGDVVWWGSSSDTLLFSASDDSVRDRSIVTIHALQLQPQPQPGPASTPARVAGVAHLLYTPAEGEAGLSLSATKDGAYVLLTSRLDVSAWPHEECSALWVRRRRHWHACAC